MKTKIAALLILCAASSIAYADFIRTIAFTLKPDCSIAKFMTINTHMNEFARQNGLIAEVMVPVFGEETDLHMWVLRYKSSAAWGKGNDAFWGGVYSEDPVETQIYKLINECIDIQYSHGWRTLQK
jgi:hypothetical protein